MKSTNYNMNNPMKVDTLDLQKTVDSNLFTTVESISRERYDLLNPKDPYTLYIVENESGNKPVMYLGEILYDSSNYKSITPAYLIGPSLEHYGDYNIYKNIQFSINENHLIEVASFNNIEDAIKCMYLYNNIGSHSSLAVSIYTIIKSYIDKLISIHELIIGIISEFGFKDHPLLQQVIQIAVSYGALQDHEDLPLLFREELPNMKNSFNNFLLNFYSDLYDLVVRCNFFKDKRYHQEQVCLANEIFEIHDIYMNL